MKLLSVLVTLLALTVSCSSSKKEDPTLEGIWSGKIENSNLQTGEKKTQVVVYEFRGETITVHYINTVDTDLNVEPKVQTETGKYKKVKDTLEMQLEKSSCAVYNASSNTTTLESSKASRKIAYNISNDLSTLTIKNLTSEVKLKRLTETEEDQIAVVIKEAQTGCFDSDTKEFKINEITPIDMQEPRSTDPL